MPQTLQDTQEMFQEALREAPDTSNRPNDDDGDGGGGGGDDGGGGGGGGGGGST